MSDVLELYFYTFFIELFLQPVVFGVAGFIACYRINYSAWSKVLILLATIGAYGLLCQWLGQKIADDLNVGYSFDSDTVTTYGAPARIGMTKYESGSERNLYGTHGFSLYDAIELFLMVPLGYLLAMLLTRRRWSELDGKMHRETVAADSPFARALFPDYSKKEPPPLPKMESITMEPPPLPDWVLSANDLASQKQKSPSPRPPKPDVY